MAVQSPSTRAPVAPAAPAPAPVASPATAQATPEPIPFRSESTGAGSGAVGAFGVTVALLAACVWLLHLAKRRGWLARWVVAAPPRPAADAPLQLEQALRLSARTTLYRVRDGGRTVLLVESLAPVATLHGLAADADCDRLQEVAHGPEHPGP
jgi:hypothetical protein